MLPPPTELWQTRLSRSASVSRVCSMKVSKPGQRSTSTHSYHSVEPSVHSFSSSSSTRRHMKSFTQMQQSRLMMQGVHCKTRSLTERIFERIRITSNKLHSLFNNCKLHKYQIQLLLVGFVWWVWFGRFGLVGLVW